MSLERCEVQFLGWFEELRRRKQRLVRCDAMRVSLPPRHRQERVWGVPAGRPRAHNAVGKALLDVERTFIDVVETKATAKAGVGL